MWEYQRGALGSVLTPRELECIRICARGLSAKEIAREIEIAPRTVEQHLDRARMKLGARNRVQMVATAAFAGLIEMAA